MKKLFFIAVLVCFVPALASSQIPGYPPSGYEVNAWVRDTTAGANNAWIAIPMGSATAVAQCWASLPSSGSCNKDWNIDVVIHASIAQWCSWHMDGTRWDWFVKKPGDYAADCISGTIASNQNILVDYHDFGDLIAQDLSKAIDTTIEVWYAVAGNEPPAFCSDTWVRSYMLNEVAEWDTIFDSQALHDGITYKLWNRIHVSRCNSACEYEDRAVISLFLCCQKPWIDRETGNFQAYNPGTP